MALATETFHRARETAANWFERGPNPSRSHKNCLKKKQSLDWVKVDVAQGKVSVAQVKVDVSKTSNLNKFARTCSQLPRTGSQLPRTSSNLSSHGSSFRGNINFVDQPPSIGYDQYPGQCQKQMVAWQLASIIHGCLSKHPRFWGYI